METPSNFDQQTNSFSGSRPSIIRQIINSMAFKLLTILVLLLFLLIPMDWVSDLIYERNNREISVSNEIAEKWGKAQVISGPVIAVPFDYLTEQLTTNGKKEEVRTMVSEREWVFLLPESLNSTGDVSPEYLKRGIYEAVVYNSSMKMNGKFEPFDLDKLDIRGGKIKWAETKVVFGIGDFKGLASFPVLSWNGQKIPLDNSDKSFSLFQGNLMADLPVTKLEDLKQTFDIEIQLRGSRSLNFLPLANQTNIEVKGEWANPSFNGGFLPEDRDVSEHSFSANWRIPNFSRKLPQFWQGSKNDRLYTYYGANLISEGGYDVSSTEVAVDFPEPKRVSSPDIQLSTDIDMVQINFLPEVNNYQKITRATKYGMLVILLTFAALVLVEIIKKHRIHFIQYILIGVAMVMFYSLLLAISEHLGFNWAYLISAVATVVLISSFIYRLTRQKGIAVMFSFILSLIYGFIFFIMQLQDYSLIVGSIGVFFVLAIVMRYSAKINWYHLGEKEQTLEAN